MLITLPLLGQSIMDIPKAGIREVACGLDLAHTYKVQKVDDVTHSFCDVNNDWTSGCHASIIVRALKNRIYNVMQ